MVHELLMAAFNGPLSVENKPMYFFPHLIGHRDGLKELRLPRWLAELSWETTKAW